MKNSGEKKIDELLCKVGKFRSLNYAVKHFCGKKIGRGMYRDVYVFKGYDEFVIKIERDMRRGSFCNATEFRHYIDSAYTPLRKWLAPCYFINETSQIMIQARCTRLIDGVKKKFPKKIPSIFTDTHVKNFGWHNGKFVCFDYPFFLYPYKMKRAKWIK